MSGRTGQLVASSVATGNGVVICPLAWIRAGGRGRCMEKRTWAPGPFPSAEGVARCPPLAPCLPWAGGTPTCAVLASINHHGLRALPFLGLWEGRGGQAVKSQRSLDRPPGILSKGIPDSLWEAGL